MKPFKINNFDLLRLFAASEVLLLHSFPRLNLSEPLFFQVMSNFPGVAMFFVMSGFLISASFERNSDLTVYFKNRLQRIFPALWMCLLITIIAIPLAAKISLLHAGFLPWLLAQSVGIIYTPEFLSSFGFGSYNGSLWTIPLELQFYVVLPMLYFILNTFAKSEKQKNWLVAGTFIAFCLISYFIKTNYTKGALEPETTVQKLIRYSFVPNVYLFLFGVLLQRFKVYQKAFVYGKGLLWFCVYLAFSYLVETTPETYIFKLVFLGFTTISLAYTFPKLSEFLLRGNDISYGVYIYHGLVLGIFVELGLKNNLMYVFSIFLISYLLGTLSWIFVEKPIMKRKRKAVDMARKIMPV